MSARTSRTTSRTSVATAILAGVIAILGFQSLAARSPGGDHPAAETRQAARGASR